MIRRIGFFWPWKLRPSGISKISQHQDLLPEDEPFSKEELTETVLKQLLQKKEFSILDGLNEYDEDYTFFELRGNIIPHEMKKRLLDEVLPQQQQTEIVECENECQDQDVKKVRNQDDQQSG
ncbi:MAG TPA: hypothetical protein EYO51_04650 [Methylococcaceae bacterium]|jgi:hypothetical protein|nr:hypothetical protein [Methylococcaceae bacterium]HIN68186.1 hypothetical protein [Methylococcales bacterium]HIA44721.1 hypothetical protein [Methylococcaceae bacterium]HIB62423.1 hypothetical protein [Methylococcaceae bacterium]HIO12534.1 hypothetical protein [Methylococcales bacterium]